jgi:hypothetical protein
MRRLVRVLRSTSIQDLASSVVRDWPFLRSPLRRLRARPRNARIEDRARQRFKRLLDEEDRRLGRFEPIALADE